MPHLSRLLLAAALALCPAASAPSPHQMLLIGASGDPYFANVVSLLDFHSSVTQNGTGSSSVSEDYKGVSWTLTSRNSANSSIGSGHLTLPDYQAQASFSNAEMYTASGIAAFQAAGDFTMELTHNTNGAALFSSSSDAVILSGFTDSNAAADGNNAGEWMLLVTGGGRNLKFKVKRTSPVGGNALAVAQTATSYPTGTDNEIAITRASGILRLFINGTLVATQSTASDATPLYGQATFGAIATGSHLLPNNYGPGIFKRWRYTVGVARYTASYTPTGQPFPTS